MAVLFRFSSLVFYSHSACILLAFRSDSTQVCLDSARVGLNVFSMSLDRYDDTVELGREVAMRSMGPASEINLNGPQVNTYEALKNDVAKDYIEHHVVRVPGQLSLPFSQVHEELGVVYYNIEPEIAVYPCAPDGFQSKPAGKKPVTNEPTNLDDFIFSRQVPSSSVQRPPILPISHSEPPRASSSSG
jgi:hypothetical protein